MAKIYIDNINSSDSRAFASEGTPYVNPFKRMGAFPLDKTEIFDDLEDATKYAAGAGDDKRKLGGTAYPGQIISVVKEGSAAVDATITDGVKLYNAAGAEVSADDIVAGTTYYKADENGNIPTDADYDDTLAVKDTDYTEPVAAVEGSVTPYQILADGTLRNLLVSADVNIEIWDTYVG